MKRVIALAVMLAACAPAPTPPSFRDQSVPIASQVDVTLGQLTEAPYVLRQAVPMIEGVASVRFSDLENWAALVLDGVGACPPDVLCHQWLTVLRLTDAGPGRWQYEIGANDLQVMAGGQTGELWILWADADRRTLAIGTPDGTFGLILDRAPTGGEDRIAAARDIMEWMGYRVDEMEVR